MKLIKIKTIFLAVMGLLLLTACQETKKELLYYGHSEEIDGKTVHHTVRDFTFVNQDSQEVTNATFAGKAYVADNFFISCPTICPKLTKSMEKIHDKFKNNENLLLISHTIDTKYDTIPALKKYADNLGVSSDKWHFVTGEKDAVYDIAPDYFQIAIEDDDAEGGYNHNGVLALIDENRHLRAYCNGTDPEDVDRFIKDIEILLAEMKAKP